MDRKDHFTDRANPNRQTRRERRKTRSERLIENLEKQRPQPKLVVHWTPSGVKTTEHLSRDARKKNDQIDNMIKNLRKSHDRELKLSAQLRRDFRRVKDFGRTE